MTSKDEFKTRGACSPGRANSTFPGKLRESFCRCIDCSGLHHYGTRNIGKWTVVETNHSVDICQEKAQ
eukprot:1157863-Pelagomonas_calceolata.AAC.3